MNRSESFLYPFLSDSFYLHFFSIAILITAIIVALTKIRKGIANISLEILLVFSWLLYLIFHGFLTKSTEHYFLSYMIMLIITLLAITYLLRTSFIKSSAIYYIITIWGIIESIVILLQYSGFIPSNSSIYNITGTDVNPNITAMVIGLSIPAYLELFRRFSNKYRFWLIPLGLIILSSLLIIQCRSILIALFVVSIVFLVKNQKPFLLKAKKWLYIIIPLCLAIPLSVMLISKKESAEGRLLIWKICSGMIAEKPILGFGYGSFEKEYNLHQAEYFNKVLRSEDERMNATHTPMAFNDYLEQTLMGGIIGGMFFFAFLFILIYSGWKDSDHGFTPMYGVIIFSVMCFFNFAIESPSISLLLILYASIILSKTFSRLKVKRLTFINSLSITAFFIFIMYSCFSLRKYFAQQQLTKVVEIMEHKEYRNADQTLSKIKSNISTSEAYYDIYSRLNFKTDDFPKTRECMLKVLDLSSKSSTMQDLACIDIGLHKYIEAEHYLKLACGIEPHLFRPRFILMNMYFDNGELDRSKELSKEIIVLKPKIMSNEVNFYKQRAKAIFDELKTDHSK